MPTHLIILGATGSIGRTMFEVIQEHRERFAVDGLVARSQADRLWEMGRALGARWIGLTDAQAAGRLKQEVGAAGPAIHAGLDEILAAIRSAPRGKVLGAMSGFAGLLPTIAALEAGMDILLANKETLVAAGDVVKAAARQSGARLIPVDSEHSAIFQCLALPQPFRRLILTCSGGPFRGWTTSQLHNVTVAQALNHPNWSMGSKITVDSATLMNKGLEIIEAHHLFDVAYSQIDVVVHPESVIHSMVEFVDGATIAQLGWPDMRVPLQVGLSWPDRWPLTVPSLELAGRSLTFEPPDTRTFPALNLARQAGEAGGLYPAVLNAANEQAVAAFLERALPFLAITQVVEETLARFSGAMPSDSVDAVIAADHWARREAQAIIDDAPRPRGRQLS